MNSEQSLVARDPISLFVPQAGIEERKLRQRLHNARVIASVKAVATVSDNARSLYWMVNDVASVWTFGRATVEDLKSIADAMVRLFLVAANWSELKEGDHDRPLQR